MRARLRCTVKQVEEEGKNRDESIERKGACAEHRTLFMRPSTVLLTVDAERVSFSSYYTVAGPRASVRASVPAWVYVHAHESSGMKVRDHWQRGCGCMALRHRSHSRGGKKKSSSNVDT